MRAMEELQSSGLGGSSPFGVIVQIGIMHQINVRRNTDITTQCGAFFTSILQKY